MSEAATYQGKSYDLNRLAFGRLTEINGFMITAEATVADIIRDACGIGYGGHFDEESDEECAVYMAVARTADEYRWLLETRRAYTRALVEAIVNVEVPLVKIQ